MAERKQPITPRKGTITFYDLNHVHSYEVKYENGNFAISTPGVQETDLLDRGVLQDPPRVATGDDQACSFTFDAEFVDAAGVGYATLLDIPWNLGFVASGWTTVYGASSDTIGWDVEIVWDTSADTGYDIKMSFPYSRIRGQVAEGAPTARISVAGVCPQLLPDVTHA